MKNKTSNFFVLTLVVMFAVFTLSTISAQEITATTLVNDSHNRVDNGIKSTFVLNDISASENSLLLLWVGNSGNLGSVGQPPTPTVTSSNGLQWELVTLMNRGGSRTIWLYRTVSTSTDPFNVTINAGGNPKEFLWALQQYDNTVLGNNGADAIVQTATGDGGFNFNSLVTLPNPASNANNAVIGGMFCGCNMDIFPGAGFTTLSRDTDSSLKVADETFTMFTEFQSTFDSTIDASWNGISAHWILIGVELQLDENAVPPVPMPDVTLISPTDNSYTNAQENVFECSATAPNDGVSTLSSLDFYLWDSLGNLVDTQTISALGLTEITSQFTSNLLLEDTYSWNCEATLEDLNSSFAAANYILTYDTTAPSVSISTPLDQEEVSGIITINADAVDSSGVASVRFFLDGIDLGTDTSTPYENILDTITLSDGVYVLTATATDVVGNSATSNPITINVNNTIIDTTAPSVSITSPLNDTTVSGTTTVTADATDDVSVVSVQFLIDGVELGTDTSTPYEVSWDTTLYADGIYFLTATATDSSGNQATSEVIEVSVDNSPPSGEEVTINLVNVADTFVISNQANSNLGTRNMIRVMETSSMSAESLAQWDLSSIPSGATIVNAQLTLTVMGETLSGSEFYTISSYRLLDSYNCGGVPWVETCPTWNTMPTASNLGTITDTVTIDSSVSVGNQYTWGVTQAISDAYNEGSSTATVYLAATDQSVGSPTDRVDFDSKESTSSSEVPVLIVTYIQ